MRYSRTDHATVLALEPGAGVVASVRARKSAQSAVDAVRDRRAVRLAVANADRGARVAAHRPAKRFDGRRRVAAGEQHARTVGGGQQSAEQYVAVVGVVRLQQPDGIVVVVVIVVVDEQQ